MLRSCYNHRFHSFYVYGLRTIAGAAGNGQAHQHQGLHARGAGRRLRRRRPGVAPVTFGREQIRDRSRTRPRGAIARPHHAQHQPDRERAGVLRALRRHPRRPGRSRSCGDAAASRTARHAARQRADVVRYAAPRPCHVQKYPALHIQLIMSDEQIDAVQEGFDVTLRIAELASSTLVARKIAPARRAICAAPAYLAEHGTPQHPDDLRNHDCLAYGHLATGNQWKLTSPDGDHWIRIPWTLCSNNAEVLRDAAVRGHGIALLPTFIAGADLQAGSLRSILTDYTAPEISVYAIYPQTRHLSVKVRVFIDLLIDRFGGRPYWDLVE